MELKITVAGDFCITPTHVSKSLFTKELIALFKRSDINIVNLECPVVNPDLAKGINKTGPHLHTTTKIFEQLKKLHINAVTLANNHILDYGEEGLSSTIEGCRLNNIWVTGAGKNLAEASNPTIITAEGIRIALVNFCENEWSVATKNKAGANPLDLINNLKQIKDAGKIADFVLVIIHGGHEHYNLPSPRMVKTYRFFAENGAHAIIGHHPHCISGYEYHHNVPIFYSVGNMIFTMPGFRNEWKNGLIVQLQLKKGKPAQFELIPIVQEEDEYKLKLLKDPLKNIRLREVEAYSEIIANETELTKQWQQFVQLQKNNLHLFSPTENLPGRYIRAVFKKLNLNHMLMRKQNLKQILNHIRCEAHRDILTELLKNNLQP